MPPSERGVSMTRSGNSSERPAVARNTPPNLPTSSPSTTTRGSRRISTRSASLTACNRFKVGIGSGPLLGGGLPLPALHQPLEEELGGAVAGADQRAGGGVEEAQRLGAAAVLVELGGGDEALDLEVVGGWLEVLA